MVYSAVRQQASLLPSCSSRPHHMRTTAVYQTSPYALVSQSHPSTLQVLLASLSDPASFFCLRCQAEKLKREEGARDEYRPCPCRPSGETDQLRNCLCDPCYSWPKAFVVE